MRDKVKVTPFATDESWMDKISGPRHVGRVAEISIAEVNHLPRLGASSVLEATAAVIAAKRGACNAAAVLGMCLEPEEEWRMDFQKHEALIGLSFQDSEACRVQKHSAGTTMRITA
jgi:hypothetical protein